MSSGKDTDEIANGQDTPDVTMCDGYSKRQVRASFLMVYDCMP